MLRAHATVAICAALMACQRPTQHVLTPACPPARAVEPVPEFWVHMAPHTDSKGDRLSREWADAYRASSKPRYGESPRTCGGMPMSSLAITEISLETGTCYGSCAAIRLRIRGDGSVDYVGEAHVRPLGHRKGTLPRAVFDELACLAMEIGFFGLSDAYMAESAPCCSTSYVAVAQGDHRKVIAIEGCAPAGPAGLHALEMLIWHHAERIQWEGSPAGR